MYVISWINYNVLVVKFDNQNVKPSADDAVDVYVSTFDEYREKEA